MQYALVNGIRAEAEKGLIGICERCRKEVIPKCGDYNVDHWAHKHIRDCDAWWETETPWHRDWKSHFPLENREVVLTDESTNEKHRADIHKKGSFTIEFQNSPISHDEMISRDTFYPNLIWVVNAESFMDKIKFMCRIPNPESPLLNRYEIYCDWDGFAYGPYLAFQKKSEVRRTSTEHKRTHGVGVDSPELKEVQLLLEASRDRYMMIQWKNKGRNWLLPRSPVFLDFGDENLYWLRRREQTNSILRYTHAVSKANFIKKYSI